jgi:hypothetical protein
MSSAAASTAWMDALYAVVVVAAQQCLGAQRHRGDPCARIGKPAAGQPALQVAGRKQR